MSKKEKAEQLFQLYLPFVESSENIEEIKYRCKKCALIAVDEMISILTDINGIYNITPAITYWQEVKQEIEKL